MAYIDADSYLKDNKGRISERSGPREPWAHSIDLRISQQIPTFANHRIEITVDILNVLNLINGEWGMGPEHGRQPDREHADLQGLGEDLGGRLGKPKYQWTGLSVTDGADPFQPDNLPPAGRCNWASGTPSSSKRCRSCHQSTL